MAAIKRGEMGCSDVGEYLKIDPATVWRWCQKRGIDPSRCRKLAIARSISRIMDADRMPPKRVMREDAGEALETWEWKNGAPRLEQSRETEADRIDRRQ